MAIITTAEFSDVREKHKDKKIVHASGMFDLLHPGHVLFFEDCKKHGDVLVVGVGGDSNVKQRKDSGRPIMNLAMRLKLVDSLKAVDYCFTNGHTPVAHPLEFLNVIFDQLRPDAYVVNEDASNIPYRREAAEKYGVEFVVLERSCPPEFENVSTSKLIEKIKNLT